MTVAIARPKLEGNIAVGDDRQIGFAEFGAPQGRAIFWLHGTPGARRQIPVEARVYAEENDIRLIGVDRPGIGSSTPLPDAELYHLPGESHLAGLGLAEDILRSMIEVWDRDGQR